MSSQPAAGGGGYVAFNSYPAAMGTFNLANGYPVGYGYPGSGMESVNGFGFAFRKRVERIDWKRLASIDVDSVARNLDFQVLQDNIINIAFCSLEAELDSRSIDPNYTKLFKLSQLMIEYLLHSQDYLCSKMQEVQQEFVKEKSEHDATKKEGIEKLKSEIVELKKELNQRKKIIAVQQQLLHNGNDAIHKCAFCAKAFVNTSFLHAHISRRHPEYAGNQMSSSVAYNQPTDFIKAPVHSTTEAAPIRHELENELLEIRERLRLTESQLVEERNARNATTQKDQKEKQKLDEDVNKRFESWKEAQLDVQKSEIEKVQDMFMKELKEMSSKLQAAEDNLEDLKRKRSHGSMLGSLKDDVDPEEIRRQRKEMAEEMRKEMHNQVVDVETRMRKEMMEHDKLWKKKMRDVKLQDKQKIVQMNGEMERLKEKENKRRLRDEDEKRRLKDEVVQRISKMENSKRSNINDNQASEPPMEKAVVVALQKVEVPSQMDHDTEEEDEEEDFDSGDEEEDDEDRNDDYHRVRDAQAAHLKKTLEDEDDEDDDDDFPVMNVKERLQNDDDLKRQCHSDNLQSLELGLEALGIPKGATHLSNDNYLRSTDTLERERNRKHKKKHDQFSAIRKAYEIEVDEKARQQLRQRPRSMPPKGSSILRTPRSNQSTLRSTQSRPNSLPPQKVKHIPKPSPRAGTLPAKLMSTGQSMMTTTQSFTSTGTLSVTGTSAMSDSNDEEDLYRVPAPQKRAATMEPRPRAKTPTGASSASSSKAAVNNNQKQAAKKELAKQGDSGDETSGWDDELSNVEPVPQARTKHQTLNSKPAGSVVTQRKLEIERQLSMRDGKKPVGGYDVTPMKSVQSRQNAKRNTFDEPDDIDVLSLTSVSAADDLRPTPKPRNANTRSVTQSTSGPTNSTNTSKWFSSVSSGVSSKSFSAKKDLELNDSWDDDDGDDDE